MDILLLTAAGAPGAVLPALDLLPHAVRVTAREARISTADDGVDLVLVDARSDLADARSTCRRLHTSDVGVPILAVMAESGLAALTAGWRVADVILIGAGPAEVETRLRLAHGRRPAFVPDDGPGQVHGDVARSPAGADVQGVRAAQVPGPAAGSCVQPQPASAGCVGIRLLRRYPYGRCARATTP